MLKNVLWLKIASIIIMVMSITALAIVVVVPRKEIYKSLYQKQNLEATSDMSAFEAELNYDEILQQIMGHEEAVGLTTYQSSDNLVGKIERMHTVYRVSKWISGLGIIFVVAAMILMRNKKWYQCLQIGGGVIGVNALLTVALFWLSQRYRLFFFYSQYDILLPDDPLLISILPKYWALGMLGLGIGVLLLSTLVSEAIPPLFMIKRKPHEF